MRVVGITGFSGVGKTTLLEGLIPELKAQGLRVSVVKHAHHGFDIDHPGKDTWRHRRAGAFEVVAASAQRLAVMREFECEAELTVHHLLAEVSPVADWVLVEGFKASDIFKIEVWRATDNQERVHYPDDPFIWAIATDKPESLPEPTLRPVLDLSDPVMVAGWLIENGQRFEYQPPLFV